MRLTRTDVAKMVDHTLLRPEAKPADVEALVAEATELGVYAVCVAPSMVRVAARVNSARLAIAAVAGFPSGKHLPAIKAREAAKAVEDGATEIDMVIDVGAALACDWDALHTDIATVRAAVPRATLKVIIESAALVELSGWPLVIDVCRVAKQAGADFAKTSTGFHPAGGATPRAVELMSLQGLRVKASGGIRSAEQAALLINAGASRLGLSGTRAVLEGFGA